MNTLEIDTFTRRLAWFTDKAPTLAQAKQAADRLAIRNRESDERRSCQECSYLLGNGSWRCGNSKFAEAARGALTTDLVQALQSSGHPTDRT